MGNKMFKTFLEESKDIKENDPYNGKLPSILKDLRKQVKILEKDMKVFKPEYGALTSILDAIDTIKVNMDMIEDSQGPYQKNEFLI